MNLKLHRQQGPKKTVGLPTLHTWRKQFDFLQETENLRKQDTENSQCLVKKNDVTKFLHVGRHVEHAHDGNTTFSIHVGGQKLLLQHYFQKKMESKIDIESYSRKKNK